MARMDTVGLWCYFVIIGGLYIVNADKLLSIIPKSMEVKEEGRTIFSLCRVNVEPGTEVGAMRWQDPDGNVISTAYDRIQAERFSNNKLKLYIRKVSPVDKGLYTCTAVVHGKVIRKKTSLTFQEPLEFEDTPIRQAYPIGTNPLIKCSTAGNVKPHMSWRFDLERIPKKSGKFEYEDGGLRIYNLQRSDAGEYECRAELLEDGRLKVAFIHLHVQYAPIVREKPKSASVVSGSDITFRCQADANPPVLYEWFREQKVNENINLKTTVASGTSHYTIKNVTRKDEGRYHCRMSNAIGQKEYHADLKIMVKPSVKKIARKQQMLGDMMILTCEATGHPTPTLIWSKKGQSEYIDGQQPKDSRIWVNNKQEGLSKLIVQHTLKSDSGQYYCTATNPAGEDYTETTLIVEFVPELTSVPHQSLAWPGVTREFTCSAKANPPPEFHWSKGVYPLSSNKTYTIKTSKGQSTITIKVPSSGPWVYGNYTCKANNLRGSASQEFTLKEAWRPSMPHNVMVIEKTEKTITLDATAKSRISGPPVTKWMIKCFNNKDETITKTTYFTHGEDLMVGSLTPGTEYTIMISAGNAVGYGLPAKFLVKTKKRPMVMDGPSKTNEKGSVPILRTGPASAGRDGKKPSVVLEAPSHGQRKNSKPEKQSIMGLIVGVIVAGLILIMVTMGLFVCYRKKQNGNYNFRVKTIIGQKKRNPDRCSNIEDPTKTSELYKPNDLNKNVKPAQVREFVQNNELDKCVTNGIKSILSPRLFHGRKPTPPARGQVSRSNSLGHAVDPDMNNTLKSIASKKHTNQNNAWEEMMKSQEFSSNDSENGNVPNRDSINDDLPPPPPFLLDKQQAARALTSSYQDVLDGYHSADNMDEDEYFEIRVRNSKTESS